MVNQPPSPLLFDNPQRNSTTSQRLNPLESPVSPSIATLLNSSFVASVSSDDPNDYFSTDDRAEEQHPFFPSHSATSPSVLSRQLAKERTPSDGYSTIAQGDVARPAKRAKLESTDSDYDERQREEWGGDMAPPIHRRILSNEVSNTVEGSNEETIARRGWNGSSYHSQSPLPPSPRLHQQPDIRSNGTEDLQNEIPISGNSPNPYSANSPLPFRQTSLPPIPSPQPIPIPVSQPVAVNKLEKSMFGVEPIDEFTREVADWIWGFCQHLDINVVEIEAKIGVLLNQNSGQRFYSGSPIESIVTDDSGLRFQSNMTGQQHSAYNRMLNSRVDQCGDPGYVGSSVRYEHSRDIDSFHPIPNSGGVKTRVTRNQKDHKIKTVVEKERMADMNIHSPKRLFDWRISVSVEKPANMPTTEAINSRYKDRISYTHQIIQVDLTKVGSSMNESPDDAFELEIEFRDAKVLLREAQKEARGEDNLYMDMVQCFLNNIRLLIRNAAEP